MPKIQRVAFLLERETNLSNGGNRTTSPTMQLFSTDSAERPTHRLSPKDAPDARWALQQNCLKQFQVLVTSSILLPLQLNLVMPVYRSRFDFKAPPGRKADRKAAHYRRVLFQPKLIRNFVLLFSLDRFFKFINLVG